MTKIIVDTNVIFSCLLNTNSQIGDLLLNSGDLFEFLSVEYLKEEITNHSEKLIAISGLSSEELQKIQYQTYSRINFISESIIPFEYWHKAINYVRDVDMDDIAFVSLSLFLKDVPIWTGDKQLQKGLQSKGFNHTINTQEILKLREELEGEK